MDSATRLQNYLSCSSNIFSPLGKVAGRAIYFCVWKWHRVQTIN